ncbi:hypothetical protein [Enterococcus durans]|uniref:Zinc finger CHC2-type domain-containing protein n=2 Tax=Enterococcus durans TaxID=53345 RepID=A0AB36S4Y5_9ENTE|nr:hypothetical protein [Enterococcus durans]EOT34465.1 hypothetical protein OMS_01093 [Enterococcus durans ATCC 6056]EOU25889.1 hypothetical protein I571_00543 [Enterococcus durans ATCC 6056]PEH43991.1 hypothetical protein CRM96_02690 [Enterococcus durans]QPQ27786.1 hypothetical protein I4Q39_02990 [Enterococcus durans]QXB37055.1 hypothetical protein I6L67_10625 [Enterococcus durans]
MINIPINVDKERLLEKPVIDDEKKKIRKRCLDNYREVTRDEFVEILNSSQSFIPSKTKNKGNKSEEFLETRVIILDVDNTVKDENDNVVDLSKDDSRYLSIEKALSIDLVHNFAFAIQKSIRYSENLEKFKIVFLLKEAITDYNEMQAVYRYLQEQMPWCDNSVDSSTRMFFGGYKSDAVMIINGDNMLDITELPIDFTMTCSKNCQSDSEREYELVNETDFVKLIKNDDKEEMKQWFKDCLFDSSDMSFNEIYERLLTIDMNKLLKSSKNLRCLFHDDHNPSASIFTRKNGHSIFYCHSSNCGVSVDFIGVVMLILKKDSRVETFNWLLENLDLYPTHFQKLKEESKVLFDTLESMEDKLFRTIRNYLEEMRHVYDILLSDVNFFDDSKESVTCILSGEQLAKKMSSYYGKAYDIDKCNKLLSFMTFIGLIKKLDDEDVPLKMLEYLNRLKEEKALGNFNYKRSNVYRLDVFNATSIIQKLNEDILPLLKKFHFTYQYFSYAWVKICFNEKEAKRVFPQNFRSELSKEKQLILDEAHEVLQGLSWQGTCIMTEKELINTVWERLRNVGYNSVKNALIKNRGYFVKQGFTLERASKDIKKLYNVKASSSFLIYLAKGAGIDETIKALIASGVELVPLYQFTSVTRDDGRRVRKRKDPIVLN